jgi:hypothetical protein
MPQRVTVQNRLDLGETLARQLYWQYGPSPRGLRAVAQKRPSDALTTLLDAVLADAELVAVLQHWRIDRTALSDLFFELARVYQGNSLVRGKFVAASALADKGTLPACVAACCAEDRDQQMPGLAAQLFTYFSQGRLMFR